LRNLVNGPVGVETHSAFRNRLRKEAEAIEAARKLLSFSLLSCSNLILDIGRHLKSKKIKRSFRPNVNVADLITLDKLIKLTSN